MLTAPPNFVSKFLIPPPPDVSGNLSRRGVMPTTAELLSRLRRAQMIRDSVNCVNLVYKAIIYIYSSLIYEIREAMRHGRKREKGMS